MGHAKYTNVLRRGRKHEGCLPTPTMLYYAGTQRCACPTPKPNFSTNLLLSPSQLKSLLTVVMSVDADFDLHLRVVFLRSFTNPTTL